MHNSKLIALLQTFTSSELREFKDFVASPFFNKNQELILFYNYLKTTAPAFSHKKIEREKVYRAIFPDRSYDEKHLNYLMSFLSKLAEQYIGYNYHQQTGILSATATLSSCLDRKLYKHYQNIYQKTKSQLDKNPHRDGFHYYQHYLLANIADRHFNQQKIRQFDHNLQDVADQVDLFYLATKLKYACEMLDRQKTLSVEYRLGMIEELSAFLQRNQEEYPAAISIYYQIYLTLTEEQGDQHFDRLKALLVTHYDQFSKYEMKEMYLLALNFCIRKVRKNEQRYVREAFDLFRQGIEGKLLYENKILSPWTFKNIIKLGLRLQLFDWTEQFIRRYKNDLAEEIRENALNYNLADLHYYKKDYDQALLFLKEVEFSDVFYALSTKGMLLKIYYEMQEEEALYSLLSSFRVYLKRNKLISDTVRKTHLNFISLLNLLVKSDAKTRSEVREKIIHTEPLTGRGWLLSIAE